MSLALTAILTLAIGVNGVVFTLINAYALRPPVTTDPSSYFAVSQVGFRLGDTGQSGDMLPEPDLLAIRGNSKLVSEFVGWRPVSATLGLSPVRTPEVRAIAATCDYFAIERVAVPILGRVLQPVDCATAAPVLVLSERTWRTRFGSDRGVVGKPAHLNSVPMTIVGVIGEPFGNDGDLWTPYTAMPEARRGSEQRMLRAAGRIREGVSLASAQSEVTGILAQQDKLHAPRTSRITLTNGSMLQDPKFRRAATLVVPAVLVTFGVVIVLACANASVILLSRSATRWRDTAVRVSLGARRWDLARMALTENALIGAAALGASLALAHTVPEVILGFVGVRPTAPLHPDWRVYAFLTVVTLGTVIAESVLPSLEFRWLSVTDAVRRGGLGGGSARHTFSRSLLVSVQIAISCALLVVGTAFAMGRAAALRSDFQVAADEVLVTVVPGSGGVASNADTVRAWDARFGQSSRIRSVAFAGAWPLADGQVVLEIPGTGVRNITMYRVSRRFFSTAGISIEDGREFIGADEAGKTGRIPVVVSRLFVDQMLRGRGGVGMELRSGRDLVRIIGVAKDTAIGIPGQTDGPVVYMPLGPDDRFAVCLSRLEGPDFGASQAEVRAVARELLGEAFAAPQLLRDVLETRIRPMFALSSLVLGLACLGIAIALAGVYSVVSFFVRARTKEFGIRVALGATEGDIANAILLRHSASVLAGIAVGLALGFVGVKTFGAMTPVKLPTGQVAPYLVPAALMLLAATLAMIVPAKAGARSSPVAALRGE